MNVFILYEYVIIKFNQISLNIEEMINTCKNKTKQLALDIMNRDFSTNLFQCTTTVIEFEGLIRITMPIFFFAIVCLRALKSPSLTLDLLSIFSKRTSAPMTNGSSNKKSQCSQQ